MATSTLHIKQRLFRFMTRIRGTWLGRNLPMALTLTSLLFASITYVVISQSAESSGIDPNMVLGLILTDLILLLALSSVIAWKLIRLWLARRQGSVGSRMQIRIIVMFSLVSAIPTIIVAVFSALFFNYGIQSWFNERVQTALDASVVVAESYLKEHRENIRADVLAMAKDLNRQSQDLISNPQKFKETISEQARNRLLTEARVFVGNKTLAETNLSFSLMLNVEELSFEILQLLAEGKVVILGDEDDRVRALVKLDNFFDAYLLVGRFVDPKVLEHIALTKDSVDEYKRLQNNISKLQIHFSFVFIAVSLLLLLAAMWVGMLFAGELVNPVSALIRATERVKGGDLNTRVEERPDNDEIGTLGKAFNRMTDQLQKQRSELIEVNEQIDARRHFIENVLSGVSAGVIVLDKDHHITLFNRSALTLLSLSKQQLSQQTLESVLPEFLPILEKTHLSKEKVLQEELTILRKHHNMTLLVRVVAEREKGVTQGYIITFDDITELVAAQRSAAWSDVARRIAHEIKNPLTPIHLAAERLRSKYAKDVTHDEENFTKYINTIIRHVGNMGKIVDEFVRFARMPSSTLSRNNLAEIVKEVVFSEEVVNPSVDYTLSLPEKATYINCDREQIAQVLANLLKNAKEATEHDDNTATPEIRITIQENDANVLLEICDNGCGFPPDLIDNITEPYVTTREKGTGLGLAIVKKIILDHDALLTLDNIINEEQKIVGARILLSFKKFSDKK